MTKGDLKTQDNNVMWYNGEKWLVKEFTNSPEEAQALLEDLQSR